MFRIPLGDYVDWLVDALTANLGALFDGIGEAVRWVLLGVSELLLVFPWPVVALLFAVIAWYTAGPRVAAFSVVALTFIVSLDLWQEAMRTTSLVVTSTLIAIVIGLPLGILAARSGRMQSALRPVLDTMQTMPSFVYLIPALMLFGIGTAPATMATIVFAMPPAVRLTNLGIRQVPREVLEAAQAFGATPFQQLVKVQLPMALPSIMAGINQTIMLSLSMAVIAAMIGAGGLGAIVFRAITRVDVGLGFEGGIAIVALAIVLDRITQSVGRAENVSTNPPEQT